MKYQDNITSESDNTDTNELSELTLDESNYQFSVNIYENLEGASNIIAPVNIINILSSIQMASVGISYNSITKILRKSYDVTDLVAFLYMYNDNVIKTDHFMVIGEDIKLNKTYINMISKLFDIYQIDDENINPKKIKRRINYITNKLSNNNLSDVISTGDIMNVNNITFIDVAYVKSLWKYSFDPSMTIRAKFHKSNNNMVQLMHRIDDYYYYENEIVQLLEIPLINERYVMGIILPKSYLDEDRIDFTANNIPNLSESQVSEFINNLELLCVDVYLPKFTQQKKIYLSPILMKIGLYDTLTDIYNNDDLHAMGKNIDNINIIHNAYIDVYEGPTSNKYKIKHKANKLFRADHIFIYYIRDVENNLFLMMGDYQGY